MPTTKTARVFSKLAESLHEKDAQIAQLNRQVDRQFVEIERLQRQRQDAHDRLALSDQRATAGESRIAELQQFNKEALGVVADLETRCEERRKSNDKLATLLLQQDENFAAIVAALKLPPGGADTAAVVACIELHRERSQQLAELAPQAELVASQRAALAKILDDVRGRMRRKELADESAVLNRKVATALAPRRNFK